jgi:hypothetical protein
LFLWLKALTEYKCLEVKAPKLLHLRTWHRAVHLRPPKLCPSFPLHSSSHSYSNTGSTNSSFTPSQTLSQSTFNCPQGVILLNLEFPLQLNVGPIRTFYHSPILSHLIDN